MSNSPMRSRPFGERQTVNFKIMNFVELLKTGGNLTVSIGIEDLKQWHK